MTSSRRFSSIQHVVAEPPNWLSADSSFAFPEVFFNFNTLNVGADWLLGRPFNGNYYVSSDDGATWTTTSAIAANYAGKFAKGTHGGRAVHFGNQLGFIAVFYSDTPASGGGWASPTGASAHSVKPTTILSGAIGAGKLVLTYADGDVLYCDAALMNGFTKVTGAMSACSSRDVVFDGTRFVSVGDNGVVATSLDGVSWTIQTPLTGSPATFGGKDIAFGDGKLFAAHSGTHPNRKIHVSTDGGVNWVARNEPATASSGGWSVFYKAGRLHALQFGTDNAAYSDDDGATWTVITKPATYDNSKNSQWFADRPTRLVMAAFGSDGFIYLPD